MSASLRKVLIIVGTVGLLSWGCGGDSGAPASAAQPAETPDTLRQRGGDDRPPIIISDGSVDFYVDDGPVGRGRWTDREVNKGLHWYHEFTYSATKVDHFDVTLLNTKRNSVAPCSQPDHVYSVKSFVIDFSGLGGGKGDVSIDGSGNFQVDFQSKAERDATYHFWLNTGGLKHLKAVTLTEIGSKTAITCEFGGGHRGIIKVRQRF